MRAAVSNTTKYSLQMFAAPHCTHTMLMATVPSGSCWIYSCHSQFSIRFRRTCECRAISCPMGLFDGVWMNSLNRQRMVSHLVFQVPSLHALLVSCLACSEKGWRDCSRFRPGVLAVTMLCSVWLSSASARTHSIVFIYLFVIFFTIVIVLRNKSLVCVTYRIQ